MERDSKLYISDYLLTTLLTSCARTRWRISCWSGWRRSAPCGLCRMPPRESRWDPWARWFRRRPSSRRKRKCRSAWCWRSCSLRRRSASTCPCRRRMHILAMNGRLGDIFISLYTHKLHKSHTLVCINWECMGAFKHKWLKTMQKSHDNFKTIIRSLKT